MRADHIHSQREIVFDPGKTHLFHQHRAYNYMQEPWILFLALFPAIAVKIYKRVSPNSPFRSGNVTTLTREPPTCAWIRADIWRQEGAICSKNRKIVPYHRCARILRWLKTVSSTFQDIDFDASLLPLVITWCYNHGINKLPNHRWTRWYNFCDTIGYHSNTMAW